MNKTPEIGGTLIGSVHGNFSPVEITTEKFQPLNVNKPHSTVRKKVLFVGWGRTGKDEAAQFAELHLGLRYGGSFSWHAKDDVAKAMGVHPMTAWETRHQHRKFWYDECNKIRAVNITELAERALATGDICAGLRDKPELKAVFDKNLFDEVVWIERPGTPEDFTVTFTRQDVINSSNAGTFGSIIYNNGTLEEYHRSIIRLFNRIDQPVKPSDYARSLMPRSFFL